MKKTSKKGEKAQPIDKLSVEELLKQLELEPPPTDQPYARLFQIFKDAFLTESIERKLITPNSISIAGDGTPVVTSARERKHRICNCREEGIYDCGCDRYYFQPDCDVGWDSSRECFYHGYDLYQLTAANSENDLPIFPLLAPVSRHDSIGFLHS